MGSGIDGGIYWDIEGHILTVGPADTPEAQYAPGQMKNYNYPYKAPWEDGILAMEGYCEVVITNGVTNIGDQAFYGVSDKITGVLNLPDTVETIGDRAFLSCGFTICEHIGDNLSVIGQSAFSSCTALSGSVTLPDRLRIIGNSAFLNCPKITAMTVKADSSLSLGGTPFNFNMEGPAATYHIYSPDNWLGNILSDTTYTKYDCQPISPPTLENRVWIKVGGVWRH